MPAAIALLSASLAMLAAVQPAAAQPDPLAAYRWRSRLLVIVAPDSANAELMAQRRAVSAARAGYRERDLVVIEALGSGQQAEALRHRFRVPVGAFRAILVGKDGEAKLVSEAPIASERLFDTIDAMPMRQDEIRGRRS